MMVGIHCYKVASLFQNKLVLDKAARPHLCYMHQVVVVVGAVNAVQNMLRHTPGSMFSVSIVVAVRVREGFGAGK